MSTILLGERDVRDLLTYPECIERMDEVLRGLAEGDVLQPVRTTVALPGGERLLGMMPGYLGSPPTLGVKAIAVVPGNREVGRPAHQGVVVLFDPTTGEPTGILEASSVTEIRTASVSAVATRALAVPDASVLGILGSGVQARAHALAIPHVRPIARLRLWDRDPARARALAEDLRAATSRDVEVSESAEVVVRSSDILCTTTASRAPWLKGEWLRDGTHVNAVGAATTGHRELDPSAVRRATVFVDHRASARADADELRVSPQRGASASDVVSGELGEVLLGRVAGRTSPGEVTIFKSVGLAAEDLAAARFLVERATALGRGMRVDLTLASRPTPPPSTEDAPPVGRR